MLQNLSSLEETAERFRKSPEFIWNMSLQFNEQLRPELGDNGLIAYSEQQRHIIGRIIRMRDDGMTNAEIIDSLDVQEAHYPLEQTAKVKCPSSEVCRKNFKVLSEQIKLLRTHISLLKNELAAMKRERLDPPNQTYLDKNLLRLHHPDA
ncbi:MAG: hypothetical protein CVV42_19700 [Candidatus Riflebacteria bacterium HGW-Riflebacteria-2]|jgi:DNA-binding transcriptional MerR regulator|nr:MAG: hypothetical protein CVV42_19700 [Candidatus Riflebacteria bacterium HGW-Riflebacteria-2]